MDMRGATHMAGRQAHLESHRLGSIKVGDLEDKKKDMVSTIAYLFSCF